MRRNQLIQLISEFGETTRLIEAIEKLNSRAPAPLPEEVTSMNEALAIIYTGDGFTLDKATLS